MARPRFGYLQTKPRAGGKVAYLARFQALGKSQTINVGTSDEISYAEAEAALRHIVKQVENGVWLPPKQEAQRANLANRTVRHALDEYFKGRAAVGLKDSTLKDYRWRITYIDWHLGDIRLDDLAFEDVVGFRDGRIKNLLAITSVNSMVRTLAAALDREIQSGNLLRNVAKGPDIRIKSISSSESRAFIDYDQLICLLDAASEIEANTQERYRTGRRYLIATLFLAGLRVSEACRLTWGDWDQIAGTLRIGESKTQTGIRQVVVLRKLNEELNEWKSICSNTNHDAPMFPNADGGHRNKDNVSRRVINTKFRQTAERILRERHGQGHRPYPEQISAHDGRRTYASWGIETGHNVAFVQSQLGHRDPKMTLGVYVQVSGRKPDPRIKKAMKRLD